MSDRKAGFYWVKLKCGEWVPCEWLPDPDYPDDVECWVDAPLSPISYAGDLQFEEIGPRIPSPDERDMLREALDDLINRPFKAGTRPGDAQRDKARAALKKCE